MIDYEKVDKLVENCKRLYPDIVYGCLLAIIILMKVKRKMT